MGLFANMTEKGFTIMKTVNGKRVNGKSRFRGVQLNARSKYCCKAVRAMAGKRFLSDAIPKLPLKDCDADECECTYKLYSDRRSDNRRASDLAFDFACLFYEEDNRRDFMSGRRSADQQED